jgi:CubicO group peptidase (beta-lactamase class C family)
VYYDQVGLRRADGPNDLSNRIVPTDRFDIGSVGKTFTGLLVGHMIDRGEHGLTYETTLGSVFPSLTTEVRNGYVAGYMNAPIKYLMTHSTGMPYNPSTEPADQWMPEDATALTDANLMARRYRFVQAAVQDRPAFGMGGGKIYGGGTIIIGAMLERLTGRKFETLMRDKVLLPLGMAKSQYGRTAVGPLDGPWQHTFDNGLHIPDEHTHSPRYDFQSHSPAGTLGVTAHDMGQYLRELLRPDPQLMSAENRARMLNYQPTASSNNVLGGWGIDLPHPVNSSQGRRFHNGHNYRSYANVELFPATGVGYSVFTNVSDNIGMAAVGDMFETMKTMEADYDQLFGAGRTVQTGVVHQMPAAVRTGPSKAIVFAKRHDGTVRAFTTSTGGSSWTQSTPVPAVFTSGLGAAASADGRSIYLAGRGNEHKIWVYRSDDSGGTWNNLGAIGEGVFDSGAAVATSADGSTVHIVGLGRDKKAWINSSANKGGIWSGWAPIGQGIITSAPAAVTTRDGAVHVFGRGLNHRVYRTTNANWRVGWENSRWSQMAEDYATSSPTAMVSTDGTSVQVGIRGTGRGITLLSSSDAGATWQPQFSAVPSGAFTSAAALVANDTPGGVTVVTLGNNFRLLRNVWNGAWGGWSFISNDLFF